MGQMAVQLDKIKEKLNTVSAGQKKLAAGLLASVIIFTVLYVVLVRQVTYGVLFTNLELAHSASIVEEIDRIGNVRYRVEDGGQTILVDEKEMTNLRLRLAMTGDLLDGTAGYELFDNQGLMVTDQDRRIMYQRATQGELERTYRSLTEVRAARVHLSMADDSIFALNPSEASATIVLDLEPNTSLTPAQIEGIVSLASGAVKDLPRENVKVLDSRANLLSAVLHIDQGTTGAALVDERQRIIDSYERRIAENLTGLLETTFGRNKVVVSVLADIDFDSEERYQVVFDENPVVRQREELYEGGGIADALSAGPLDNNVQNLILETEDGVVDRYEAFTDYEVGRTEISTVKAVGLLQRLNISVVYDGALSGDMLGRMERIVTSAAGIDLERGDQINIDGIAFDRTYEEELAREMEEARRHQEASEKIFGLDRSLVSSIVGALGALILLVIGMALWAGRRKNRRRDADLAAARTRAQQRVNRTDEDAEGDGYDEDDGIPSLETPLDDTQKADRAVKKYAKDHPAEMAELLKSWIKE